MKTFQDDEGFMGGSYINVCWFHVIFGCHSEIQAPGDQEKPNSTVETSFKTSLFVLVFQTCLM
ncbi:hypothetical protein FGIG_04438 [Fasciola gigantica]|uniref:Uncharacterized protein n=1 Tax=Fasciola gigantica TaxID=46835 RepID=A0A504YXI6_FASGI|nr:hypothetical protein FGIG_04438 [Fasciola gigantica]